MNLPDYIVLGAAKCGTSSLCNYLNRHPDVFMTKPKELDFFGRQGVEHRLEEYSGYFEEKGNRVAGEGSVSYMLFSELAAQQISRHIPNAKLIMMLRNPADRFYSDFWFNVNRGMVTNKKGLFEGLIKDTIQLSETPFPLLNMSYRESLLIKGDYTFHLKNYLKYFDRESIKIVFFEDFVKDRQEVLDSVFEFIGVKSTSIEAPAKIYNKTKYPGKMGSIYTMWKKVKPFLPQKFVLKHRDKLKGAKDLFFTEKKPEFPKAARKELINIYMDSIIELEEITGRELSNWKE